VSGTPRIAIVGTGAVARALASAYVAGGGEVTVVVSRRADRGAHVARLCGAARGSGDLADVAGADAVLVAVPDRALGELAARLASLRLGTDATLLHTSGALAGAVLDAAGGRAGSLHPLQSFPDAADERVLAARVAGTHWFHEGHGAVPAEVMVAVWRGTFHRLAPGAKSLYHAGAAVLSNHAVALFDTALRLFEAAGIPRADAHAPLAALLAGTSANLGASGVPAALTGPIARGDVDTVRAHVEALRRAAPELVESYLAMARRTLVVARAKGSVGADAASALERLLGPPPC